MAWLWMGDISARFPSLSLLLPLFLSILQPSCANEARVLRSSCRFSGQKMKRDDGKKEKKRLSENEREREKEIECPFLAWFLLSAQFSRPVVLLDFPPGSGQG